MTAEHTAYRFAPVLKFACIVLTLLLILPIVVGAAPDAASYLGQQRAGPSIRASGWSTCAGGGAGIVSQTRPSLCASRGLPRHAPAIRDDATVAGDTAADRLGRDNRPPDRQRARIPDCPSSTARARSLAW